jgi:hypothetical protein
MICTDKGNPDKRDANHQVKSLSTYKLSKTRKITEGIRLTSCCMVTLYRAAFRKRYFLTWRAQHLTVGIVRYNSDPIPNLTQISSPDPFYLILFFHTKSAFSVTGTVFLFSGTHQFVTNAMRKFHYHHCCTLLYLLHVKKTLYKVGNKVQKGK